MIQFELDYVLDRHQHWLRDRRFGSRADFTSRTLQDLDLSKKDLNRAIFTDSIIRSCNFTGTYLTNIDGCGAHIMHSDFTDATFKNSYLQQVRWEACRFSNTDLWNVSGDGTYIVTLQLGGYNICYTSEILQINCLQFDIKKVWSISDEDVLATVKGHADELAEMAEWWTQWRDQIDQIIKKHPAKSVNSPPKVRKMPWHHLIQNRL